MIHADAIAAVLPHRYPMLLVDRVLSIEPGKTLRACKAVTVNEPCYDGVAGQPGADVAYPPVLLVESWCQAAGVLAAWDEPNPDVRSGSVMLFGSIADLVFGSPVLPGSLLEHEVRVVRALTDTLVCEGETTVDGERVLTVGRVVMALRPASVLEEAAGAGR